MSAPLSATDPDLTSAGRLLLDLHLRRKIRARAHREAVGQMPRIPRWRGVDHDEDQHNPCHDPTFCARARAHMIRAGTLKPAPESN